MTAYDSWWHLWQLMTLMTVDDSLNGLVKAYDSWWQLKRVDDSWPSWTERLLQLYRERCEGAEIDKVPNSFWNGNKKSSKKKQKSLWRETSVEKGNTSGKKFFKKETQFCRKEIKVFKKETQVCRKETKVLKKETQVFLKEKNSWRTSQKRRSRAFEHQGTHRPKKQININRKPLMAGYWTSMRSFRKRN